MNAPELRPLRIGEILDVAIKLYRSNAATLLKIVLIVVGPIQVVATLVQASTIPERLRETGVAPATLTPSEYRTLVAGAIIITILGLIGSVLSTGACFQAVSSGYLGHATSWKDSLAFAGTRFKSLLWVTVLSSALAVLALIPLILPGVYLWVAWALVSPVLLVEGIKGRAALGRSRSLVVGRWWPTFAALFLAYMLTGAIRTVVSALASNAVLGDTPGVTAQLVLSGFSSLVGALITTPFLAAAVAIIYFDLRVRKEGFDLQLLARHVGVAPGDGEEPGAPGSNGSPPSLPKA